MCAILRPSVPGLAVVLDPDRLALGAWHLAGRLDDDLAGHPDQRLEAALHLAGLGRAGTGVAGRVGHALHLHGHGVERPVAGEHDLVIRREAGKADYSKTLPDEDVRL